MQFVYVFLCQEKKTIMDICNSLDSRCGPRLVRALTLVRIDEVLRDSRIIQLTIDKIR
jgi:hypothetical protein